MKIHSVLFGWGSFNGGDTALAKTVAGMKTALQAAKAYGANDVLFVPCKIEGMRMPKPWEFDIRFDEKTGHLRQVVAGDNAKYDKYIEAHNVATDATREGIQLDQTDPNKLWNQTGNNSTVTNSGTTVQLPTFSFVTVTTTVSVPDGGTVLLGGIKRLSEGRNEFGVPMLDKLPYISRLFKNVGIGRETQSLMMMVTPRIIIQEEEEEKLGVLPQP